ncbi:hypothetical protein NKH10_19395 [Mesorhizobium sp. M1340]|uniref:hypothetical protein n=1 Tax=Mesorhizobium sp. M1340 TaxID=2957087 RepID=UPI0033351D2B
MLAAKVRNSITRECQQIAMAGQAELAEALEKSVVALSYDQILRLRRAILVA